MKPNGDDVTLSRKGRNSTPYSEKFSTKFVQYLEVVTNHLLYSET